MPKKIVEQEDGVRKAVKSERPAAIRKRLRRHANNFEEDHALLQKVTLQKYKPIEEWTLEELAQGKPRGENGKFDGPKPKWLTPAIREEVQRRMREETLSQFAPQAAHAVRVLADFLRDDENPRLKFDAAKLILEYVIGKPDMKVALSGNVTLQSMLADALVLEDGTDAHPVIDGQFVEVEEDDVEEL